MSDATTIVGDLTNKTDPQPDPQQDYLSKLVGEGKKYQNTDALAKAYLNADEHIKTVLEEKRELEEKYKALELQQRTMDDILSAINPPNNTQPTKEPPSQQVDVAALVDQRVKATLEAEKRAATVQAIQTKLVADLGGLEKAKEAITNYTKGDKTKESLLDQLVLADYTAALQIIKGATQPNNDGTNFGTETQRQTTPISTTGLTWKKCEEVRKKDPKLYNSPKFQRAMHEAAAQNKDFMNS